MNIKLDPHTLWILAGLLLLAIEMLSGTFVLMFVGFGCLAAGLFASFPGMGNLYTIQLLICAVVSVLGFFLLRNPIQKRLLRSINLNADLGKEIKIDHAIPPHQTTRITYQGTSWFATNLDTESLNKGDHVVIVGIDGNTLLIRKVH